MEEHGLGIEMTWIGHGKGIGLALMGEAVEDGLFNHVSLARQHLLHVVVFFRGF